jgi:hypothetical protein
MASQTKVEPVERSTPLAPGSGVASTRASDSQTRIGEGNAPTSSVGLMASGEGSFSSDDEDVSLDELMMSDSNEADEEPDEATDVQSLSARTGQPASVPPPAAPVNEPEETAAVTEPEPRLPLEPFAGGALEDDEEASLAAAAAAQEAAAEAAAAEADEREERSRRSGESLPEVAAGVDEPQAPEPAAYQAAEQEPSVDTAPEPVEASVATEAIASGDEFEASPPSVELEATDLEAPAEAVEPSARLDGPLPSFDIPEAESTRRQAEDESASDSTGPRTLSPALAQLSEAAEEDDDDAVTHIGLPVVPESTNGYGGRGASSFQVAEPDVAALQGFDPDLSLLDARRATTRVVPRIDPAQLQQRRMLNDTNPPLSAGRRPGRVGAWLSGVLQRYRPEGPRNDVSWPLRRRAGWLLDTVLPPLSLVLFGSGIGAGIMLLQPDRGAKAAQQTQAIQSLKDASSNKRPTTLAERAEAGEGDALFKITNMAPNDRSSALTLALERGYQVQKQNEFKEFANLLEAPGGMKMPNLTARFLNYATSPETMLPAFAHLLNWPGSTGPDVLYGVWEKAPGGSRAASLAQQLLHSEDQRAKATPALVTALDLRSATSCEDYLRVLPAVQRDGDQRCSATLRALKHRDGCGDDGKQDCFACLRDGTQLEDALTSIEKRPPPQL